MSWPATPTNGQQVEINGILYQYSSTDNAWSRIGFVPAGINIPFLQTPNLSVTGNTSLGNVGNVRITGGSADFVLKTDGTGNLDWVAQSAQAAAGNSTEVQFNTGGVFAANPNLKFFTGNSTLVAANISGAIVASSQPGITNVGTLLGLAVSGNIDTGNLNASMGVFAANASLGNTATANYFTGVLTSSSQPNITSLGALTVLSLSGNVVGDILPNSSNTYDLGSPSQRFDKLYLSSNGISIGTVSVTSGSGNLLTSGNFKTAGQFISTLSTGTAPFVVSSNTQIGNLNAELLQGYEPAATNTPDTVVIRDAANSFAANVITANLSGNATTAGTVVTAAQPNITSVGILTSLSISGTVTSGNAILGNTANANFFVGSGNNLSNIQGPNVAGTVANATYAVTAGAATTATTATSATTAGTVTTAAQPNITSVGTLTSLSVSGTITSGNATLGNTVTANYFVGSLTGNVNGNINLPGANTFVLFNNDGVLGATSGLTFNRVSNLFNVAGNINSANANLGNIATANFFQGNGSSLFSINGANVSEVANANYATYAGTVTNSTNANYANYVGNVVNATQSNITTLGTLTGLSVGSGTLTATSPIQITQTWNNASVAFTGIKENIIDTNSSAGSLLIDLQVGGISKFSVLKSGVTNVANLNAGYIAGTLTTVSQPNITSVGNLLSLTVTGNITANNVNANVFGNINGAIGGNTPNIGIFTQIQTSGNANVFGNLRAANANLGNLATANFFQGDGSGLYNVSVTANSQIINGNSNVVVQANNNIRFTSSSALVMTITSTGANIQGYANITGAVSGANFTSANAISGGNLSITGTSNLGGINLSNLATFQQTTDIMNQKTSATGTVTHNFQTGAIYYHTSVADNFTVNLTNVPTTGNRTIVVPIIIEQGISAYIANQFQIDGVFQTVNWLSNTIPVGTANAIDVVGFTLIRTTSDWKVLGQLASYGG
jgi:hypothetical protein